MHFRKKNSVIFWKSLVEELENAVSCKQFVNCYNGNVVQHQSCAQGTIFDVNILGCNWVHLVNCPAYQEAVDNRYKQPFDSR